MAIALQDAMASQGEAVTELDAAFIKQVGPRNQLFQVP
jgi:hypothetical protein